MNFNRPLHRINPKMASHCYRTHAIVAPLDTHYRVITCQEANCLAFHNGWNYPLSAITQDMARVIKASGKSYRLVQLTDTETYIVFPPGQQCFEKHRVSLERPAFFYTGRGDHRLYRQREARLLKPEDWVDDMQTHCDNLRTALERG